MTEPDYELDTQDDDDDNGSPYVQLKRDQIKSLQRDAKQARKSQQEADSLRRELAFARAGVGDLTERQQKALFATIDGDVTADAVREAAVDLGFMQPPPTSAQDAEQAEMQKMSQASAGASDPGSEDSVARLHKAAAQGRDALLAQLQADGVSLQSAG